MQPIEDVRDGHVEVGVEVPGEFVAPEDLVDLEVHYLGPLLDSHGFLVDLGRGVGFMHLVFYVSFRTPTYVPLTIPATTTVLVWLLGWDICLC